MKEVLQVAYLRHLQDFYLFESVKDGIIILCFFLSTTHFQKYFKASVDVNRSASATPAVTVVVIVLLELVSPSFAGSGRSGCSHCQCKGL